MGVQTFILDRRTATLMIGGGRHTVGTLRSFFKLTELNEERAAELDAAALIRPSPAAALVVSATERALASAPKSEVTAHLVIGWDEGRGSVTDFGWDYLPHLGYGVRDATSSAYVLHEELEDLLHPMTAGRAQELGFLDERGQLIRHGQPRITTCQSVRPYMDGYAEAECSFNTGTGDKLLVMTPEDQLPPPGWFIGKRPMDVQRYDRSAPSLTS